MGIYRTDWILLGIKLNYDKMNEDWYEDENEKYLYRNSIGEMSIIPDGMSEKYVVAGKIIACKKELEWFEDFHEFDLNDFKEDCEDVRYFIQNMFHIDVDPKIIIFTQWS